MKLRTRRMDLQRIKQRSLRICIERSTKKLKDYDMNLMTKEEQEKNSSKKLIS